MPRTATDQRVIVRHIPALVLHAPHWFERKDFVEFLNGERETQQGFQPATWHTRERTACELSDVFMTYDNTCGSDMESLPDDIAYEIRTLCIDMGFKYGIIRISPIEAA